MADETLKIPDELAEALKNHKVIPFIGAGLSRAVEKKEKDASLKFNPLFPSWGELIEILAEALTTKDKDADAEYIRGCLKPIPKKYLEAMQHAKTILKDKNWYPLLDKELNLDKALADESTLEATGNVWNLGSNLLITTNIDKVLQWNCPNSNPPRILDAQTIEYGQLQKEHFPSNPTVWHLHGYIDNKEKIIFTEEQYKSFYDFNSNEAKLKTLLNFLTQHTFLFIGFSLDDPYFLEQIKYLQKIYGKSVGDYYVLFKKGIIVSEEIKELVEIVEYEDYGEPFLDKLKQLSDIVKEGDDSKKKEEPKIEKEESTKTSETEKKTHFNVPFASKGVGFIGRKDKLKEIRDSLLRGKQTHIGQARNIQGLGGLGKTQLAVEYADKYRDEYPNGVYWLTADADISNQLIPIGEANRWIFRDDKSINQFDVAKERFLELKDSLIIFDNVESVDDIKSFIPKDKKSVHILITSRSEQDGFKQIDLETLSKKDSKELLLYIADRKPQGEAEIKAFEELIKELDGLPLALELVGGYLAKRTSISFENYLNHFKSEPFDKIASRFPKGTFTKEDVSIIRTLTVSKELLNNTPYLQDILDVLAWSGSSSMSVSLLQEMIQPEDTFDFADSLDIALQLKLLKQDENAERYAIHRLLGRVRQLERPLEDNQQWQQKVLNGLIEWFKERKEEFLYLIEYEEMLEHLEKWEIQSLNSFSDENANLIWLKAYPVWHRGNYQKSKEYLDEALNIYKETFLYNQELKANILADLDVICNSLGEYKNSLEIGKIALEIRKELFGHKHRDIAMSYNNVGGSYGSLGNHQKALEYHEKALEIRKELFGHKHHDIAMSYDNIGSTYGDLGNHQKALEYQKTALEIRKELFGHKHPDTAISFINIGSTYGELGNHQKALEYKEKALEIRKELFGHKHPDIAMSYNSIGFTYRELGNRLKSLEYHEKALNIQTELLGKEHPNTILLAYNTVISYLNFKIPVKAGILANEYFKFVPQNHPNWKFFEEKSRPYRKKNNPFKKRKK